MLQTILWDYGGLVAPADLAIRIDVPHDKGVVREVRSYGKLPVAGLNVLDIGGHIGSYAVLAAKMGASFVTAVEPHAENFEIMSRNMRTNARSGRYECIRGAAVASERSEKVVFWSKPAPAMGSIHVTGGERREVDAVSWRRLHAERRYQIVKLDCEGAEYELVLDGGLPDSVTGLILELHLGRKAWRNRDAPAILDLLSTWRCLQRPKIGAVNWVTWGVWTR